MEDTVKQPAKTDKPVPRTISEKLEELVKFAQYHLPNMPTGGAEILDPAGKYIIRNIEEKWGDVWFAIEQDSLARINDNVCTLEINRKVHAEFDIVKFIKMFTKVIMDNREALETKWKVEKTAKIKQLKEELKQLTK